MQFYDQSNEQKKPTTFKQLYNMVQFMELKKKHIFFLLCLNTCQLNKIFKAPKVIFSMTHSEPAKIMIHPIHI